MRRRKNGNNPVCLKTSGREKIPAPTVVPTMRRIFFVFIPSEYRIRIMIARDPLFLPEGVNFVTKLLCLGTRIGCEDNTSGRVNNHPGSFQILSCFYCFFDISTLITNSRNAPVKAMKEQHGYHVGYTYPHNSSGAVVSGDYFPIDYKGERAFYQPTDRGFEAEVRERMQKAKEVINS
jgi:hypothetical protein